MEKRIGRRLGWEFGAKVTYSDDEGFNVYWPPAGRELFLGYKRPGAAATLTSLLLDERPPDLSILKEIFTDVIAPTALAVVTSYFVKK